MAPRTIRPETETFSCAVCGRRLLQGEQPEVYLAGGSRRTVCELCTTRANQQGWIRERGGLQVGARAGGQDRPAFWDRLRARRERRAELGEPAVGAEDNGAAPGTGPPEATREPRHVHAVPSSDDLKTSRAAEVFNGSEHPRTVAGVARSLGEPVVAIHPSAGQPTLVSIVVSWELCWYRYEVDLADEGAHGVRMCGQGYELSELAAEERVPNAAADEHGRLAPAA